MSEYLRFTKPQSSKKVKNSAEIGEKEQKKMAKLFANDFFDINLQRFQSESRNLLLFYYLKKITKMKKLVLLLAVISSVALFSCSGNKAAEEETSAAATEAVDTLGEEASTMAPEAAEEASVAPEAAPAETPAK